MSCDHKFVDSNACLKCGVPAEALRARANIAVGALRARPAEAATYTDDVVAVMRDTITALREQVVELRKANDELKAQAEGLRGMLAAAGLPVATVWRTV